MDPRPRKFTIGRDKNCDVAIADDSVSRLHAELAFLPDGKYSLSDCDSSNGTVLVRDGKSRAIKHEIVSTTDRVRFGRVELAVGELVDAVRRRYAAIGPGEVPSGSPPLRSGSAAAADRPVRCSCGAIKPANDRCPGCGE